MHGRRQRMLDPRTTRRPGLMSVVAEWFGKRSSKLIVASSLFAVAGGIIVFRLLSHETLEEAALRFDHCLLTQNTGCMYDYMHPDEIALLDISEDDFDQFMQSYVYTQLSGFSSSGALKLELVDTPTQLYLKSHRSFRHPDGREISLRFRIHMGDAQPRVVTASQTLIITACYADLEPGEPFPGGLAKFEFLIQCYNKHMPIWEAAGLYGYTRINESGDSQNVFALRRFDDAIDGMTRTIARVESN